MKKFESTLENELRSYLDQGQYPLHMPGHKRRCGFSAMETMDLTELPDTDDLHAASGILRQAMERTAQYYHADRTWYLVNGSTCGNLAAVFSAVKRGEEVIAARNCHRSVFHALQLRGVHVHWAMPEFYPASEISGCILPETISELLARFPAVRAVLLTSPTYEGCISDIAAIADLCHARNIPLIVDEAHGAHLGFGPFPPGALSSGADLVVQSPHKTLFSLTQTAWLHLKSRLISPDRISENLAVFESSSPSYPLMLSLDSCSRSLQNAEKLMSDWMSILTKVRDRLSGLHNLKLYSGQEAYAYDPGKLLILTGESGLSGRDLAERLRSVYRFEVEMYQRSSILAMTSPADEPAALLRFADAVLEIDQSISPQPDGCFSVSPFYILRPETSLPLCEAAEYPHILSSAEHCIGEVSGEYIFCYPPGIPLLIPGEKISADHLKQFRDLSASGLKLHGSVSPDPLDKLAICFVK